MLCFYHFQMAKACCQLVAWFKDTRVTQKSIPVGRVGRSVGRQSCWSVHGWVAQVDKNYHIRQELFRPTTSLDIRARRDEAYGRALSLSIPEIVFQRVSAPPVLIRTKQVH